MKLRFTLFLAIVALALAFTECKKKKAEDQPEDPAPGTTTTGGINTIAEVFTANGAPTQVIQVSSTAAQTITVNGVKIEIPANAFVTTSSGTITGMVDLSVRTILTKSEVILSGAGANSTNGRLVTTKGCVKITATQNSQSLRLGGGGGMYVNFPSGATSPPPMKKYYASKVSATDSTQIWKYGTDTNNVAVVFDGTQYLQKASLDSLKWLNVGKQWDTTSAKTTMTVTVNSSSFSKTNTAVYVSFNGSLTVGAMYEVSPGVFRITNMPVGKAVNIVGVAVINGQYYSAIMPVTVSAGFNQPLPLTAVSLATLQSQLAALP